MCGIAGFYHTNVDQHQVAALTTTLHHRGPDDLLVYRHNDVLGKKDLLAQLAAQGSLRMNAFEQKEVISQWHVIL